MGSSGNDMEAKVEWIWMNTTSDKTSHVSHIRHQETIWYLLTNFGDTLKIWNLHKGGIAD